VRWQLWGTYAFLAVADPTLTSAARATADRVLADVDQACSRFRDDSDLSQANRRPGHWFEVGPLLVAAVRAAVSAAEATDGLVDPCLGRAMVSLGYDRDLALLREMPPPPSVRPFGPTVRHGAWREIGLHDDAVRVPDGVALDLGATAKAWAADLLAERLVADLGCATVVSLGGDVRVAGPDDASWPVRVTEHPDDGIGVEVRLTGGMATSTTAVRRWRTARDPHGEESGGERHHLLDPRTGLPVREAFRTVSAVGETCLAANTASTAAMVLGAEAPAWLAAHSVSARLVGPRGTVRLVGGWPATPPDDHSPLHTKESA